MLYVYIRTNTFSICINVNTEILAIGPLNYTLARVTSRIFTILFATSFVSPVHERHGLGPLKGEEIGKASLGAAERTRETRNHRSVFP